MSAPVTSKVALLNIRNRAVFALFAFAAAINLSACSKSNSSVVEAIQNKIIATTKPDQISSLKSTYEAGSFDQQLTVVGRIYAEGMSPFDSKESIFTIVELPKPGHLNEDPGDCPFCRRDLKNAKMAIVQVTDQASKPYPHPADKLLGLKKNQDVVVTGKPRLLGNTLVIQSNSIYCLPLQEAEELSKQIHPQQTEETKPAE